jgi:hypothetical protein
MSLGILWIVGMYANNWTSRMAQKLLLYLCLYFEIYISKHLFHACPIVLMETWAPLIILTLFLSSFMLSAFSLHSLVDI